MVVGDVMEMVQVTPLRRILPHPYVPVAVSSKTLLQQKFSSSELGLPANAGCRCPVVVKVI